MKFVSLMFTIVFSMTGWAQLKPTYRPWVWKKSHCVNCPLVFKTTNHEDKLNAKTNKFIQTLTLEKSSIVKLYKANEQEYNLLAWMAIGVLGNESEFFTNWRYKVKRNSQLAITTLKEIDAWFEGDESIEANSKGPTQIKKVPVKIAEYYNIKETDLWEPKNAAVATMGFLIESLTELRQRAVNNNLEFITNDTIVDYLPYIYFGGTKKLVNRTATPDKNIYVKKMKQNMKRVQPFEVTF